MADNIYDLRKYHIKDMKDAMSFLELVEARIPEIVKVVRKQTLVEASLKNRLSVAENRPAPAAVIDDTDNSKNQSVLTQLTNQNSTNVRPDASRLAQMKAAAQPKVDEAKKNQIKAAAAQVKIGKLPNPIMPGEIGELNTEPIGVGDATVNSTPESTEVSSVSTPEEISTPSNVEVAPEVTDPNHPAPEPTKKTRKKSKGITRK